MRSYDECVRERFSAYGEPMPESVVAESNVVRRFLEAAGKVEVEDAQKTARELRELPEGQAVMRIIAERRGDASDILLSLLAQGASGFLAAGVAQRINRYVASVPGLAMVIAGFVAKQPYAVRQALVNSGLTWVGGALAQK